MTGTGGAACGAGTELVCENFDGSTACGDGSHTNCSVTWTQVNSAPFDFNYATSPAPLEGTYSGRFISDNTNQGWTKTFTAQDVVHFFFIVNAHTLATSDKIFRLLDASDNEVMSVSNAGYEFDIHCGTTWAYSTTMSVDTTYYIWGDYTKGTGANAVCHLFHSTDTTKGAADITITTGDATAQAAKAQMWHSGGNLEYVIDKIRIGTSAFGDNPT